MTTKQEVNFCHKTTFLCLYKHIMGQLFNILQIVKVQTYLPITTHNKLTKTNSVHYTLVSIIAHVAAGAHLNTASHHLAARWLLKTHASYISRCHRRCSTQ